MAQISSLGALPEPELPSAVKTGSVAPAGNAQRANSAASVQPADDNQASPLQSQISRLSTILNALQQNAGTHYTQYVRALKSVQAGSYQVNSLSVSRSMVKDLLGGN